MEYNMTNKVEISKETTANVPKIEKLASANTWISNYSQVTLDWVPEDVDKLEISSLDKFKDVVKDCRFYYKRDPIASTVLNKLVEIGVTDLVFDQGDLGDNEYRVFLGVRDALKDFIESCAMEYLISGLVVPEIKYAAATKEQLIKMGVKKYSTLELPVKMWLRDPTTIKINYSMVMNEPSYFVIVPDELIWFIMNNGKYRDGTSDPELFAELTRYYPDFVAMVKAGKKEILLENDLIIRRKPITGSPYPIPYLYPALESLKHKRNLRRMDYSLASRAIGAIQLFNLGNDEYPVTEDDDGAFDSIRAQMQWRNSYNRDFERIFQLFANHTLKITWVMPDLAALVNERKYAEINQDIFFALGFPRILTTGETERTQTSSAEFAMISPVKTMENLQAKLLKIAIDVSYQIYKRNNLKGMPEVSFKPVNLFALADFLNVVKTLYDSGNVSRHTLVDNFGFDWDEEVIKREAENEIMKEKKLGEFAPQPFSPAPDTPGGGNPQPGKPQDQGPKPAPKPAPKPQN